MSKHFLVIQETTATYSSEAMSKSIQVIQRNERPPHSRGPQNNDRECSQPSWTFRHEQVGGTRRPPKITRNRGASHVTRFCYHSLSLTSSTAFCYGFIFFQHHRENDAPARPCIWPNTQAVPPRREEAGVDRGAGAPTSVRELLFPFMLSVAPALAVVLSTYNTCFMREGTK
jgi:hypothetical protein